LTAQSAENLPAKYSISGLADTDPEKFSDWVAKLPLGEFRDGAQIDLAYARLAHGDTGAAVASLPQNFTSDWLSGIGDSASTAGRSPASLWPPLRPAQGMAMSLLDRDLQSTVNWVGTLPAGPSQAGAAFGLAQSWAQKSPEDAANWLQTLSAGTLRDGATAGFANAVIPRDPAAAAEWIEQIDDPQIRAGEASFLMSRWPGRDPAQAKAWVSNLTGVPDSFKNYWLHHLQ
jgi:hypothetical protein